MLLVVSSFWELNDPVDNVVDNPLKSARITNFLWISTGRGPLRDDDEVGLCPGTANTRNFLLFSPMFSPTYLPLASSERYLSPYSVTMDSPILLKACFASPLNHESDAMLLEETDYCPLNFLSPCLRRLALRFSVFLIDPPLDGLDCDSIMLFVGKGGFACPQ